MTTFQVPSGRHTARTDAVGQWLSWSIVAPLVAVLLLVWLAAAIQLSPAQDAGRLVPAPAAQAEPRTPASGP